MPEPTVDSKRRRFFWGMLLVWAPLLTLLAPIIGGLIVAMRDVSAGSAVGTGLVLGGTINDAFALFGMVVMLLFEIAAVVLLLRALGREHPFRAFFAGITIAIAGGMIVFVGLVFRFLVFPTT